ncbi:hypothetical protein FZC84_01755 [Rossellomorea vietnamensis]|uniref:Uncharacterized protein n=1 Tax=Rossellomorea vietnamensis TaxID=218284 RepID=A0A5D4MHM6_9BACI|nr:hypothetical protein [Rossellomorea vietnamensis]TYS01405.1 hypothetical protein FZC84_01755 [Rossellomorea vietnamensis]
MTQYIYIASPIKLPQGSIGANPVSQEKPMIFKTELDAVHLLFENNYDADQKKKISYSPHFSFEYGVAAYANQIPFKYHLKGTQAEEKCLKILYGYMEGALQASGILEYFTSLTGKEDLEISKKRNVQWSNIKSPYDLVMEDREFLTIML